MQPDELMEEMKVFEHGYNNWSSLVGPDEEKSFDMELPKDFNGQAGESRFEF